MKKLLGILLFTCLVGCMALPAEADDQALGMLLVKNFFALMLSEDWPVLERHLAPCFQSIHSDGARDRAQEMALFKKLKLGSYKLSNFKITCKGEIVVVTYTVSVQETIDGKRTDKAPALRLSVFSHNKTTRQILAHVNLKPLAK